MFIPFFSNVLHGVGVAKYTLQRWGVSVSGVGGRRQYFSLFGVHYGKEFL